MFSKDDLVVSEAIFTDSISTFSNGPIEKESGVFLLGNFNPNIKELEIFYSNPNVASELFAHSETLEIDLGKLKKFTGFFITIASNELNEELGKAKCTELGGENYLHLQLKSSELYGVVAARVQTPSPKMSLKISFFIDGCWGDEMDNLIFIEGESYSVNSVRLSFRTSVNFDGAA